jgi:hypothetical protein
LSVSPISINQKGSKLVELPPHRSSHNSPNARDDV